MSINEEINQWSGEGTKVTIGLFVFSHVFFLTAVWAAFGVGKWMGRRGLVAKLPKSQLDLGTLLYVV